MPSEAIIAGLGALLLVTLALDAVGRRIRLPRVTMLILLGVVVGPIGLDLLPAAAEDWYPVITDLALVMVGFLIGREFTRERMRELGRKVAVLTVAQAIATTAVVAGGLVVFGVDVPVALVLGGIAAATAPASTVAVVHEDGQQTRFTRVLLGMVALDDVLGLLLFSALAAVAGALAADGASWGPITGGLVDIGGAVALGVVLGAAAAAVVRHTHGGEPTLEVALGLVLVSAGLGMWLDVSIVLLGVVLGATVANVLHRTTATPFRQIERAEWPLLIVFFFLAGATLEVQQLTQVAWLASGYVVLRAFGKVAGTWLGDRAVHATDGDGPWLGIAMLPQAGVALGLALVVGDRLPELQAIVVPVVVASTVVFELLGPIGTRWALKRSSDTADV